MSKIKNQLEKLKKKFKRKSIYSTQQRELTDTEYQDVVDRLQIQRGDGEYVISKDISLTFKYGRVYITSNISIHGNGKE